MSLRLMWYVCCTLRCAAAADDIYLFLANDDTHFQLESHEFQMPNKATPVTHEAQHTPPSIAMKSLPETQL